MTVNDILAKLYEVNKILDTLGSTHYVYLSVDSEGDKSVEVDKLEDILEDYKSMLGNMKVKE